ncbi:XTP/dITP diphosphatase [Paenibacillus sp. FSL R5-0887]|jgi:XTP/dITP diphosphohydrolase|uniref:dITP/XTP pyrophosphatase n=1 Tax=Paenibacillus odorifer TaxID=189426 RepID=A0A1R0WW49_9BACL|nr:XTP/dITP diphosphatase [Paenibacillus odorifer]OMC67856.1 non-canonical purine NTP pyrophosphatase, RdgB/HAM1 family [Paenibacillus odorifer]OMD22614.1 non-canonical purine NTP pyrophosphatase, RdgB/HAM1 family [Paenibacillus odorifer]OMD49592.1 non-canonical purine NTP pyrophosphatase, RdgB/HAM1 family [Paenibacillus odorifer]OMD74143.1 non-canonical purine NTP pyrophosphatase, RdgB/HAM1 family [Paenibacillus odorifer]OMD75197.1 non-canonical purine NTP pyrophosphatase, RdgB/HAM1 family [P
MNSTGNILIVATKNKGKVREFEHAFAPLGLTVKSMYDYPHLPDVVEDGATFAENAFKKSKAVGDALGIPVLADDSGLCVDALDGRPGVYSARFAGEDATDGENNLKLLSELERLKQGEDTDQPLLSTARFVCTLSLYDPVSKQELTAEGAVEGWITSEPSGAGGFGYDPLFYLSEHEKTMAELTLEEKQQISHRGTALRLLTAKLEKKLAAEGGLSQE